MSTLGFTNNFWSTFRKIIMPFRACHRSLNLQFRSHWSRWGFWNQLCSTLIEHILCCCVQNWCWSGIFLTKRSLLFISDLSWRILWNGRGLLPLLEIAGTLIIGYIYILWTVSIAVCYIQCEPFPITVLWGTFCFPLFQNVRLFFKLLSDLLKTVTV